MLLVEGQRTGRIRFRQSALRTLPADSADRLSSFYGGSRLGSFSADLNSWRDLVCVDLLKR